MNNRIYIATLVVALLASVRYFSNLLFCFCFVVLTIASVVFGISIAVWVHVKLSSRHKTGAGIERVQNKLTSFRDKVMNEPENDKNTKHHLYRLPVVFGRTVDSLLQQLLDLVIRDYVHKWLEDYAYESETLMETLKEDLWGAIQNLHDRMVRVDHSKLIAVDVVSKITYHFEKIRFSQTLIADKNKPPVFNLSPHLMSNERELDYLRKISEMLIMFLLPRGYSLSPAKYLLREILTCKILQPIINCITEPDYINQKIVNYIEAQQAAAEMHRKTYEYANSFEDFLHLIQNTKDIDALKRIRYNIMTEIMQATTMQNLKRAKGVDPDVNKGSVLPAVGKSDVMAARKLKRYISLLTFAKSQCEKNLQVLGWDGGFSVQDETHNSMSLASILDHVIGRKYLSLYLETVASQGLVGYWSAVEELRVAHRSSWHQLGAEIFYTYIRSPTAEIKVDKSTRKRMEAFLLGDKGPEVFYEVQQTVFQTLEDKYYQTFILSSFYKQMMEAINSDETASEHDLNLSLEERQMSTDAASNGENGNVLVGDHSNYSKRKLNQLQEKLNNKMQALQALRSSLKPESKVLAILEREVEWLQGEKRQLEAHISRTEIWGENLGKWRAVVQSAEIPDEKEPPQFVIVVHMMEEEGANGEDGISSGWVVLRTLAHFQELHRKLRPLCAGVKNLELPTNSFKFLFGKNDRNSMEKAKNQIQKYLEYILEDDRLNQSEALYSFLSPSSDHLKYSTPSPKKSRFSFATLFKSGSGDSQGRTDNPLMLRESEEEDISQCLDAPGAGADVVENQRVGFVGIRTTETDGKDQIAEPLYTLMGEIFDLRGVFKWLRKSLITFVQITYGRTINRQIRDTITWCFSESMLHYYISLFIKSWWPGGALAPDLSPRPRELKIATAVLARKQFVNNVPEVLMNLVGNQTAKRGALKIFDTVQNPRMNKQLFYDILDMLLKEVFPELKS